MEAWSSSGWPVCRSTRSISSTSIHWLSSCLSSASRCCVAIFSRASRSISCSYSFSFLFRDWRIRQGPEGYPEQELEGPQYCKPANLSPQVSPPIQAAGHSTPRGAGGRTAGSLAGTTDRTDAGRPLPGSHPHPLCAGELPGLWPHPPSWQPLPAILWRIGGVTVTARVLVTPPPPLIPRCPAPCHRLPSLELIPQRTPKDLALLSTASFISVNFNVPKDGPQTLCSVAPTTPVYLLWTCLHLINPGQLLALPTLLRARTAPAATPTWAASQKCPRPSRFPRLLNDPRSPGMCPSFHTSS